MHWSGFNGNERKVSYQYSEVNDLTIPTWFNLKNSGKTPIVEQHMELRRLMVFSDSLKVHGRICSI
ncbi:Uncharacterised protein [Bacteroides thetaiotaomicron]|nr:hypothetical protein [Bacteroides thetaiotaomicron]SPU29456.1 Uncharacterised protein [Bacteroides thetaiotaomicron]